MKRNCDCSSYYKRLSHQIVELMKIVELQQLLMINT